MRPSVCAGGDIAPLTMRIPMLIAVCSRRRAVKGISSQEDGTKSRVLDPMLQRPKDV
ncbi:hypothetical protein EGR_04614 [Echinococcus granulosus]|uniref:Uncharacterized protein n=1 Tax=Echinococcus granulosus TaxID=6210 RepID=W6UGG6_ECHGR|nr:hypothetical protein EGR_04614 [Echinococcus granulosus]EUB60595.1 hypothetical protein EGR_04614 [Echinococcus granulosus]